MFYSESTEYSGDTRRPRVEIRPDGRIEFYE